MRAMMQYSEITPERREKLIEGITQKVAQYGMITPAIFFLEMNKPLSYIGSQAMHFFSPIVSVLFVSFEEYAYFFEDRANLEALIVRLEEISRDEDSKARDAREAAKAKAQTEGKGIGGFLGKLLRRG
jgi:hypothetical protein